MAVQTTTATSANTRSPFVRLAFAGVAVGILSCVLLAYIGMFVRTTNGSTYVTVGDYLLVADGIPFVLAPLMVVAGIHGLQGGRDGVMGRIGAILTAIAMTAFEISFVTGLMTRKTYALGPIYPIAMVISLLGLVIFVIGMIRARTFPWWPGPVLIVGWLVGGPLAAFAVAPLVLALVYAAIAILLGRRGTAG